MQRNWQPRGLYTTPSARSRFDRERSQTPPHWRAEQSKTKKLSDLLKQSESETRDTKDTRAPPTVAPAMRDDASAPSAAPASTGVRPPVGPEKRSFRELVPERERDRTRDRAIDKEKERERRRSPHERKQRRSRSTSRHRSSHKSHERRRSRSRSLDKPRKASYVNCSLLLPLSHTTVNMRKPITSL